MYKKRSSKYSEDNTKNAFPRQICVTNRKKYKKNNNKKPVKKN